MKILLLFLTLSSGAVAQERLGLTQAQLEVQEVFIQTQATMGPMRTGGFENPAGKVTLKSRFGGLAQATVTPGSATLLGRPRWSQSTTETFVLLEAEATLFSDVGDWRAGQMLVPFTLDGMTEEDKLWFPRTLFYENAFFPLRDVGAGLKTESDGFVMSLLVHNGEGGALTQANPDDRVFATGMWAFKGAARSIFGMSLTAGRVVSALLPAESRMRGGSAFFGFNIFGLGLQTEATFLQTNSDAGNTDLLHWHFDAEHPLGESLGLVARWEQLNPNTKTSNVNVLSRLTGGLEWHSQKSVSRLTLLGIKNWESQAEVMNDEFRLIWRLVPIREIL